MLCYADDSALSTKCKEISYVEMAIIWNLGISNDVGKTSYNIFAGPNVGHIPIKQKHRINILMMLS